MANTVNKHLNIYVNGKEVENTIKSIDGALGYLRNKIRSLENDSPEQKALIEQYRQLKKISDDNKEALHGLNKEMKSTSSELENMTDKTKKWFTAAAVFGVGKIVVDTVGKIRSSISEYVEAFATLDDALAAVRKTTGMTTGEVDQLKESLKNIDTRTATNELLKIAEQGGRLGIAKEDIESFTKAVDVANVALGDSFGGGAEEIATVLGKIRNAYKETNTGEIGDSFNRIGSVINELGATSAASEQNIAEFTRRVGAMPEVFKPSIQEAMALGAAFEENSVDAEVASRSYAILLKTASADIDKFAQAMGEPVDAMRELINTNPTAFALKFSETLKGLNATQTGEYLKNLVLNADGVSKALGALSNNTDRVREMIQTANTAFSEGTSLMNEFNVVNNNTAAQLEKAKKAAADATAELGEKLAPVLVTITNGTAGFMKVLGSVAKVLLDNKAIALAAAAAYATLYAIKSKNIIMDKAHSVVIKLKTIALSQQEAVKLKSIARTAQKTAMDKKAILTTEQETLALMKKRIETLKGIAADNQMKAIMAQEIVVKNAATLATRKQAQAARMAAEATKAQKAAFASTPWGAIIMAVTAIAAGIYKLATHTTAAEKAMKELNEEMARGKAEVDVLFDTMIHAEKGSNAYNNALKKLKETYPDVLKYHIDENGNLKDIKQAYDEVTKSVYNKIAAQYMEQKKIDLQTAANEKILGYYNDIRKQLTDRNISEGIQNVIIDKIQTDYRNLGHVSRKTIDFMKNEKIVWNRFLYETIFSIEKETKKIAQEEDKLHQYIKNTFGVTGEAIDETKQKIKELEKELSAAESKSEKKSIQEEIKLLKEKISLKTKNAATDNNDNDTTDEESKIKNKWADFYKKLQSFRDKDRVSRLQEWEKTKAQIEQQYNELIEEANTFGEKGKVEAAKLESEKGDAVIKAGQDYLKKYADVLKKFEEETKKLAAKTDLSPEQSQMATDILGSQQEWDDKIAELQTNIDTIGDMVQDMDFDDENYTYFANMLSEMIDAQCAAITQKGEATANIVEKYARDAKAFVQTETADLTKSQMSEYDRQIAAIDERYNAEIKKVEETILAKKELFKSEGNGDDVQNQIEELQALIVKLNELRAKAKSNVKQKENNTDKNSWQKLSEMIKLTPEEFKRNWLDNIRTVMDAMNDLASTMSNIFGSISTIQKNRDDAELKSFNELMEKKNSTLENQYQQGLISEADYNAKKDKLQRQTDKKEKEIQHEAFERNKKASIVEATITGMLAAMKSFADLGFPWGLIPMALSLATTGAQIAAIASQVNPYAKGGRIKNKQIILAGEEGEEWIASNKLLRDKKTLPVINALEAYQQGNSSALDILKVPVPSQNKMSTSAKSMSSIFADKTKIPIINNYYNNNETENKELLNEIKRMNQYLSDPKNRQAVISKKILLTELQNETTIRNYAKL